MALSNHLKGLKSRTGTSGKRGNSALNWSCSLTRISGLPFLMVCPVNFAHALPASTILRVNSRDKSPDVCPYWFCFYSWVLTDATHFCHFAFFIQQYFLQIAHWYSSGSFPLIAAHRTMVWMYRYVLIIVSFMPSWKMLH